MDEKTLALVAGLAGAAITGIIAKGLEFLQFNLQHKLTLKNELFLRKLEVFEMTIANWNYSSETILSIATMLKLVSEEDRHFSDETFSSITKQLDKVLEDTQKYASAIHLYIELNDDELGRIETQRFVELVGEISHFIHFDSKIPFEIMKNKVDELYAVSISIKEKHEAATRQLRNSLERLV